MNGASAGADRKTPPRSFSVSRSTRNFKWRSKDRAARILARSGLSTGLNERGHAAGRSGIERRKSDCSEQAAGMKNSRTCPVEQRRWPTTHARIQVAVKAIRFAQPPSDRSTLSSNSLHRCYVAPSPSLNLALRIVSRSLPLSHVLVISARRPALRSPMLPAPFPARAARENEVENSRGWEESKRPRLGDRNSRRKTRVQRSIKPAEADEEMGGGEKLAR